MSFLLSAFGVLLLILSICLVVFGVLMALSRKTRGAGSYFALWWVTGAAAASGIVMRDGVTFAVGGVCFLVAGAVFFLENRSIRAESTSRSKDRDRRRTTERTTAENPRRYRRRAS